MPNPGYMLVQFVHLLALSLWIGGTVALGALTAPILFRTFPSRSSAGQVLGEILRKFDRIKDVCGVALIVTSILKFVNWERNWNVWFAARYLAVLVMISTALVSGWVIAPSLRSLRAAAPAGRELPAEGVDRFQKLHRASVVLMQVGLVAALVALILS